ncbi:MAG: M28 family peptidase, partial [Candidatus Kariarchaeaceae archaeon]
ETHNQRVQYDLFTTIWDRKFRNLDGHNIIATKRGKTSKTLVIAAHHDTVVNSPGADDNGTGVVLLMWLADQLKEVELDVTLMLVSFDFEELGLIGSSYFVEHLSEVMNPVDFQGVFVLEMLGYYSDRQMLPVGFDKLYFREIRKLREQGELHGDFYTVVFNGTAKKLAKALKKSTHMKLAQIRDPVDIPILGPLIKLAVPMVTTMLRSDHTPFWRQGLPAVMVTDTADFRNPHYHTPTDTVDTIDFDRLQQVADSLLDMVLAWK